MKLIQNILRDVATSIRDKGVITSVDLISQNIYEIKINEPLELTFEGDIIEIENSISNNGEYKITSIAYDGLSFKIETKKMLYNETGNFRNLLPDYEYGYFDVLAKNLTNKNFTTLKNKKFPLIFLYADFSETRKNVMREAEIEIYLLEKTKQAYTIEERNQMTFPKLRAIYKKFIEAMKINKDIYNFEKINYKEIANRENVINEIVDVIYLKINTYLLKCNQ